MGTDEHVFAASHQKGDASAPRFQVPVCPAFLFLQFAVGVPHVGLHAVRLQLLVRFQFVKLFCGLDVRRLEVFFVNLEFVFRIRAEVYCKQKESIRGRFECK